MQKLIRGAVLVFLLLPTVGNGLDLQKGLDAYATGDYAGALREFRPLSDQGNVEAQLNLAGMYYIGRGVIQDYDEAMKWYLKAAEQGNSAAQSSIGSMYDIGQGVFQNHAKAMKWYLLSAKQGNADAQFSLGFIYELAQGVPQDNITAHMWYNLASANGNAYAPRTRDELAQRMLPSEISEAVARAKVCMSSEYNDCE